MQAESPGPPQGAAGPDAVARGETSPPRGRRPGEVDLGPLPRRLGRYEVLERIGAGGMGTVFRARQLPIDRIVALKLLAPDLAADRRYLRRFVREARAAGALDHPNIVRVYDVGSAEGHPYICMEYVAGPSLERLLRERIRLPPAEAVRIALQLAQALDYAHRSGVIHCDVKPDNVLLAPGGAAKLADLGLARMFGQGREGSSRREPGMGTPHYVAVEQARDAARADSRSDIYSLGATLYHMLTGRVPFDGSSTAEILTHAARDPLVSPRALVPEIPESLSAVVERMMARSPEDRYRSAAEVLHDLREVERELAGLVPAALLAKTAPARAPRGPEAMLSRLAVALAAVTAAALVALGLRPPGEPERQVPAWRPPPAAPAPPPQAEGPAVVDAKADPAPSERRSAPAEDRPQRATRAADRDVAQAGTKADDAAAPVATLDEVLRRSAWSARAARYGEAEAVLRDFAASAPEGARAGALEALHALHERAERESEATLALARELAAAGRTRRAVALLSWALSSWGLPVLEARAEEALRQIEAERLRASAREEARGRAEAAAKRLAESAEDLARRRRFAEAARRLEAALGELDGLGEPGGALAGELRRRLTALEALDAVHAAIRETLARGELRPLARDVFTGWGSPDAVLTGADGERLYVELGSSQGGAPARAARRWEDLTAEEYARLASLCARPRSGLEVLGAGLAWLEAGRPQEAVKLWKVAGPRQDAAGWLRRPVALGELDAALRRSRALDEIGREREALRELEAAAEALGDGAVRSGELDRLMLSLARDVDRSCGTGALVRAGPGETEELFYDFSLESSRRDWRLSGSRLRQGEQGVVSPSGGNCLLEFDGAFVAGGEIELTFRFLDDALSRVEIVLVPELEPHDAARRASDGEPASVPAAPTAAAALSVEDLAGHGALARSALRVVAYRRWREFPWSALTAGGEVVARGVRTGQAPHGPERPVIALAGWVELRSARLRGCLDPEWRASRRRERESNAAQALKRALAVPDPGERSRELERVRSEFADCRRCGALALRQAAAAQLEAGRQASAASMLRLCARLYPDLPEEAGACAEEAFRLLGAPPE